jgi:YD repeat-containing protein
LTKTDARGVTANYTYDALSRNTQVSYSDGTPTVIRRYDGAMAYGKGKLWQTETANTALVTVSNSDAVGRPATLQQQFWATNAWSAPYAITREYDLTKPTKQTYPSGHTTNYAYDAIGRLASFTGNLGDGVSRTYAHEITYDAGGRLARERYGTLTPLYHQMNFNGRGQMYDTRLGTSIGGVERGNLTFNYSPTPAAYGNGAQNNGNLLQQFNAIPNSDTFRQDYDYDKLNRLAAVNEYKVTNGTANFSFTQAYNGLENLDRKSVLFKVA